MRLRAEHWNMINDHRFSLRRLLKDFSLATVVVLLLSATANSPLLAQENAAAPVLTPRPFRMGFTAFPPDVTVEALKQTRQFVRTNADLIAHHIEGVPWAEALADKPFPKELVSANETKRSMKPPGAKVFLAISPGRGELKLAEKGTSPLPPELRGKSYDDPAVQRAYLNYCRRSIEFFQPDFLAIGIEVNEIFSAGADKWRAYAELHRDVYRELKREHPGLPIFASYTLHNLFKHRGGMLKACQELMPFNDLVAISFYPFFIGETPDAAFQWLTDKFRFVRQALRDGRDERYRGAFGNAEGQSHVARHAGKAGGLHADTAGPCRAKTIPVCRALHPSGL